MAILLLALVPVLVVMYYYYHRDRHPEPWGCVALVFVLGALSTLAAFPLELAAQSWVSATPATGPTSFLSCLLIPGLIEEALKLLVVLLAVFWRRDFDEPVDGLIYGTSAALGFAFAEDWFYYLQRGPDWARALSTVAHPWFSCFWAACLGWAKFGSVPRGTVLILAGLATSSLVHGLFDFFILTADALPAWSWLRHLVVPLMIVLYLILLEDQESHAAGQCPNVS